MGDRRARRNLSNRLVKLALVAPYDLSIAGGVNTQIRAQAGALRARGHAVDVYGPASGPLADGERSLGGATSVRLGGTVSGLGLDPRGWRTVRRMTREQYDVVHVHEPFTPVVPWLVLMRTRSPLVGTFHVHREPRHHLYAATRRALTPLARRLSVRIAVSDAARRTVARYFPGHYEIVPNGIDVERFRAPRPRPREMPSDEICILCVGRLEARKGVENLVRAGGRLTASARVRLVIVGDGPERRRLETLARQDGVSVVFAGAVADRELPAYFQASDIVCAPSLGGESFGIVLLEAMACGKPVVASDIDGYAELLRATGGGELVPPRDVDRLTVALTRLSVDAIARQQLGSRGLAGCQRFEWRSLAAQLEDLYRACIRR